MDDERPLIFLCASHINQAHRHITPKVQCRENYRRVYSATLTDALEHLNIGVFEFTPPYLVYRLIMSNESSGPWM